MGSPKKKKKPLASTSTLWAAAMAIVLVPTVALSLFSPWDTKTSGSQVIGVIDGDTIVVEGKNRVRLRQLDAPELEHCGGEQAKKKLESLVSGKRVRIDELVPDQRGRGMGLVYVEDTLVNEALLRTGWVRYHHDISTKEDALKAARDDAKNRRAGIYGTCQSMENTKNPRCQIKGNIDGGNGKKRYYLSGCAQYTFTVVEQDIGEQWFCTEKEALKAGYTKAATCHEK